MGASLSSTQHYAGSQIRIKHWHESQFTEVNASPGSLECWLCTSPALTQCNIAPVLSPSLAGGRSPTGRQLHERWSLSSRRPMPVLTHTRGQGKHENSFVCFLASTMLQATLAPWRKLWICIGQQECQAGATWLPALNGADALIRHT